MNHRRLGFTAIIVRWVDGLGCYRDRSGGQVQVLDGDYCHLADHRQVGY